MDYDVQWQEARWSGPGDPLGVDVETPRYLPDNDRVPQPDVGQTFTDFWTVDPEDSIGPFTYPHYTSDSAAESLPESQTHFIWPSRPRNHLIQHSTPVAATRPIASTAQEQAQGAGKELSPGPYFGTLFDFASSLQRTVGGKLDGGVNGLYRLHYQHSTPGSSSTYHDYSFPPCFQVAAPIPRRLGFSSLAEALVDSRATKHSAATTPPEEHTPPVPPVAQVKLSKKPKRPKQDNTNKIAFAENAPSVE
ncbi:hypothetical protein FA15DRAFT_707427 [Coprinopsis marcescibilis]|uniref:Uncharacterized protein n=1 Tax=Coprinopsis marcescibilis TaxID=230819 RepID=A0A5C3KLN7_COPMA|nr:hypothetical protein FA15DRAFT_707427 [Coprinopsis marcescibilis]